MRIAWMSEKWKRVRYMWSKLSNNETVYDERMNDWTRNVFCGTWYQLHSHVHNKRTVPTIMDGCTAHARNGHIYNSCLKSDVIMVFLDPDFLKNTKISAICVHLRHIWDYLIFAWVFRTSWPKMRVWGGGKIGKGVVQYWPPMNSFLLLGVLTSVPILVKIDQEMPWECPQMDRYNDTLTDANRFYNLSHAICYSYGTDNYENVWDGWECSEWLNNEENSPCWSSLAWADTNELIDG